MKKRIWNTVMCVMIGLLSCGLLGSCKKNEESFRIEMEIEQLQNGDAKLFNDHIITNVGGKFTIYDQKGIMTAVYPEIAVNWLDGLEKEMIIVYGNFDHKIGILKMNENFEVVENHIIMESENLQIDPTILKIEDSYYITVTEISGNVNNADPTAENGYYRLQLYQSGDLENWTLVSTIIETNHNIEDVDICYDNDRFYVFFEKEVLDKGKSAVQVAISKDAEGTAFSEIHELLPATCDHEPAAVEKIKHGYRLYYSCDKNYPGESYNGGEVFYAEYDQKWNQKKIDEKIQTETERGILLYDVENSVNGQKLLYAKNYLTENTMVLEER